MIAEFPTTFEAAEASRMPGMNEMMCAPNIVRGGSHSGNVAASELAQLGLLDILSSDYYPASLLYAAFRVSLACWISSLPTTTPPACWMRRFAWPMTRATALRCRRR